jgi:tRNA threonylcarbamoyladenosine biosynthesis protein TsaE
MAESEVRFTAVGEQDLKPVARYIAARLGEVKVWLFFGDLGAGKTTLIKVIGEELGVDDQMASPSFAIVNEYHSRQCEKVFHFDFYRIKNEVEALDIGIEEYFYSGYPCFIEWPEKIPSLLPEKTGEVTLEFESETTRTIAITVHAG